MTFLPDPNSYIYFSYIIKIIWTLCFKVQKVQIRAASVASSRQLLQASEVGRAIYDFPPPCWIHSLRLPASRADRIPFVASSPSFFRRRVIKCIARLMPCKVPRDRKRRCFRECTLRVGVP